MAGPLKSSYDAALARYPSKDIEKIGYALMPYINRRLHGVREWYKEQFPLHAGEANDLSVGRWFGDLKGKRTPWIQARGKEPKYYIVVRGFDQEQSDLANKWAQSQMQWRHRADLVGKRAQGIQAKYTGTTALVPWSAGYAAEQSAKYGFVGPMPSDEFWGPTKKNANGFEQHATAARLNRERVEASNVAKDANARFAYDMMDEFDQKMHDLTERYGGDSSKADSAYRKLLQKELPPFFKNSKASTKNLAIAANAWRDIQHMPFGIGKFLTSPVGAGLTAWNTITSGLAASDKANVKVSGWQNLANVYGFGSSAFQEMAFAAGVQDPGAVASRLGKHALTFGGLENAEMMYRTFGAQMRGMSKTSKMYFAQAVGFDPTDVMIAELLAGNIPLTKQKRVMANKAMIDATKTYGLSSGSGFGNTAQALWLSVPGVSSSQARDVETFRTRQEMVNAYDDAMKAASSGVEFDKTSAQAPNAAAVSNSTDSHNVQINQDIHVGGGADEAAKEAGDKIGEASRTAAMSWFDGKVH